MIDNKYPDSENPMDEKLIEEGMRMVRVIKSELNRLPLDVVTFAGGSDTAREYYYYPPIVASAITSYGGKCINIDSGPKCEQIESENYIHIQRNLVTDLLDTNFNPIQYAELIGITESSLDAIESSNFLGAPFFIPGHHNPCPSLLQIIKDETKYDVFKAMNIMRTNIANFSLWALKDDGVLFFNLHIYRKHPKNKNQSSIEILIANTEF